MSRRGIWVTLSPEEIAEVEGMTERLGLTLSAVSGSLLRVGLAALRATPALPHDEAVGLVKAHWGHYFTDPVLDSQGMAAEVQDAIEAAEIDGDVGHRLVQRLAGLPGEGRLGVALKLALAMELIRERKITVDEAIVRAGLTGT